MKNSVVTMGTRVFVFLASLMASVQVSAAEITVFNRGLQTILDTAWGRFGVLIATLAVVGLGFQFLAGRVSGARAGMIIIGIIIIWGAVEIFNAFA